MLYGARCPVSFEIILRHSLDDIVDTAYEAVIGLDFICVPIPVDTWVDINNSDARLARCAWRLQNLLLTFSGRSLVLTAPRLRTRIYQIGRALGDCDKESEDMTYFELMTMLLQSSDSWIGFSADLRWLLNARRALLYDDWLSTREDVAAMRVRYAEDDAPQDTMTMSTKRQRKLSGKCRKSCTTGTKR